MSKKKTINGMVPKYKVGDEVWMYMFLPNDYHPEAQASQHTVESVHVSDKCVWYHCSGGCGGNHNAVFDTEEEAIAACWQTWLGKIEASNDNIPAEQGIYVEPLNTRSDVIRYIIKGWADGRGDGCFRFVAYPGFKIGIFVDVDEYVKRYGFHQLFTVSFGTLMQGLTQLNGKFKLSGKIEYTCKGEVFTITGEGAELKYTHRIVGDFDLAYKVMPAPTMWDLQKEEQDE